MASLRQIAVSLKVGSKVHIEDDEELFEGVVKKVATDVRTFSIHLERCRKVGCEKMLQGVQEFSSETISDIKVFDQESSRKNNSNVQLDVNFIKPSKQYVRDITNGMTIQIKCLSEEGIFEGVVSNVQYSQHGDGFAISLMKCHKVGSTKCMQGIQEFISDNISGIGLVGESQYASKFDKKDDNLPIISRSRKQNFALEEIGNENDHLSRLYPLQMGELLEQKQIVPPPEMKVDQLPLRPRILPVPAQEVSHMTGKSFKGKEIPQYRTIRESTWSDKFTPPALKSCPIHLYFIDKQTIEISEFSLVKDDLSGQSMIGCSIQGKGLSRLGEVSVIVLSTRKCLYLFDVVSLGEEWCFSEKGFLRELFEDRALVKVIHDSRVLSDVLKNKFNILLSNVYDTLAAHVVFSTWGIYSGYMPRYAMPLSDLVRGYLGICPDFIAFQHTRNYARTTDTEIWMKRPLAPELETVAVYESMYLLDLQRATREAMNKPFLEMTQILLSDVSCADDLDCAMKIGNLNQLPYKCTSVLPNWKPNEAKASRHGVLEDQFVHQTTCQLDPMLNFSRDVMHQKKPPGEYRNKIEDLNV